MEGSSVASPCPTGSISALSGRTSLTDCSPCPSGSFCNSSALKEPSGPCSPGLTVQFQNGKWWLSWSKRVSFPLLNNMVQLLCITNAAVFSVRNLTESSITGYFCSLGSSEASPFSQPYGDVCPMGHFCPQGSGSPRSCPVGSFLPEPGASSPSHCHPCPPGKYCLTAGGSQPTGGGFHQVSH